jgi:cell division protein FtsQ
MILAFSIILIVVKRYKIWLHESESFKIRKVKIQGTELLSEKKLFELSGINPNGSIWKIDLKKSEKAIEENPFVENVFIKRQFPDILDINLEEKRPIALLNFKEKFYCLDAKGMILPSKPGKLYDLPIIAGKFKGVVTVGREVRGNQIHMGLDLLKLVLQEQPQLYTEISEIVVGKSEGLILYTKEGGVPVRLGDVYNKIKIRYLEAILCELVKKRRISMIKYIDLRFDGQVVLGMRA